MQGNYCDDRIFFHLQRLQNENPNIKLLYFNDDLCSELSLNQDLLDNINENISGRTNIEKALSTLLIKNPEYKKVLVLTDEDSLELPEDLSRIFEVFLSLPNQMYKVEELWI